MDKAQKTPLPTTVLVVGALLALALAAGASAASKSTNLSIVGYSTPKAVMGKITSAYQKTGDGEGVSFTQSYGASTDQARAVANGLKADLVFLSTGDDVNLLVDAGLVDSKWNRQSYNGIAADTVVVFAVRNGNPAVRTGIRPCTRESGMCTRESGRRARSHLRRKDGRPAHAAPGPAPRWREPR